MIALHAGRVGSTLAPSVDQPPLVCKRVCSIVMDTLTPATDCLPSSLMGDTTGLSVPGPSRLRNSFFPLGRHSDVTAVTCSSYSYCIYFSIFITKLKGSPTDAQHTVSTLLFESILF